MTTTTKYSVSCTVWTESGAISYLNLTDIDIHVERIYRDREWWGLQLEKLKTFYFDTLLPELAAPRHRNGGIREPSS